MSDTNKESETSVGQEWTVDPVRPTWGPGYAYGIHVAGKRIGPVMQEAGELADIANAANTALSSLRAERDEAWSVVSDAAEMLSPHGFPSSIDDGNSSGGQPITLDEQITDAIKELLELRAENEMLRSQERGYETAINAGVETIVNMGKEIQGLKEAASDHVPVNKWNWRVIPEPNANQPALPVNKEGEWTVIEHDEGWIEVVIEKNHRIWTKDRAFATESTKAANTALSSLRAENRARINELWDRCQELQDACDMNVDEFTRIKSCPAVTYEIKELCDRAIVKVKQTVPIIEQIEKLRAENEKLKGALVEIDKVSPFNGGYKRVQEIVRTALSGLKEAASDHVEAQPALPVNKEEEKPCTN